MRKFINKSNDKLHNIFTVVIIHNFEYVGDDVSTVSFEKFEDAINYCITKIGKDNETIQEEITNQMYYNDVDTKYYIKEANLIH